MNAKPNKALHGIHWWKKFNATRRGTHDSHKCCNWSQNLSCYKGKIFKNERGKNQLSFHLEKLDVIKLHDAPLASTSKATLIYVSNSLSIPSYFVESLHIILKKMITLSQQKKTWSLKSWEWRINAPSCAFHFKVDIPPTKPLDRTYVIRIHNLLFNID